MQQLASVRGRHQNGASEGDRCGNAAVAAPGHGWLASAGSSQCRRRRSTTQFRLRTEVGGADDDSFVARHATWRGEILETARLRRRWETDFTICRLRSAATRCSRPGSLERASAQTRGWWSEEQAHGRRGHRDTLGTSVRCMSRRRWRLVGAYIRSNECFGARTVGVRTERQEGNGRGDAVRLLARGILRRV